MSGKISERQASRSLRSTPKQSRRLRSPEKNLYGHTRGAKSAISRTRTSSPPSRLLDVSQDKPMLQGFTSRGSNRGRDGRARAKKHSSHLNTERVCVNGPFLPIAGIHKLTFERLSDELPRKLLGRRHCSSRKMCSKKTSFSTQSQTCQLNDCKKDGRN